MHLDCRGRRLSCEDEGVKTLKTYIWLAALGSAIQLFAGLAQAQYEHVLLRRLAVFPIGGTQANSAEEAWWQAREVLTKDQRFLVASRRFMINRGVFQARESLKPADAIILGKILDAQALVTSFIVDRRILMNIYDGENGYLLWAGELEFHPALPINEQLVKAAQKLMNDFLLDLPYQGYQIVDSLREKAVFEEAGERRAWVSLGNTSRVEVGDSVQWIEVVGDPSRVFFKDGSQTQVIGEGQVVEIKSDRVLVKILRVRNIEALKENSLVRFPKEIRLLKDVYMHKDRSAELSSEYLASEMKSIEDVDKRHAPTTTSLAFIFNLVAMILLAF